MKIYTKTGDDGTTSLMNKVRIAKCEDRVELLGTIDELSSLLGLAKVIVPKALGERLSHIQKDLMQMMAGIAEPGNRNYRFTQEHVAFLEAAIDKLEESFARAKEFVLYGGCEQSARLDVARAVARRTERRFWQTATRHSIDRKAVQYINRLSDYLYLEARYADAKAQIIREQQSREPDMAKPKELNMELVRTLVEAEVRRRLDS